MAIDYAQLDTDIKAIAAISTKYAERKFAEVTDYLNDPRNGDDDATIVPSREQIIAASAADVAKPAFANTAKVNLLLGGDLSSQPVRDALASLGMTVEVKTPRRSIAERDYGRKLRVDDIRLAYKKGQA